MEYEPYSYQKWLKEFLLEKNRTRHITWLVDIVGNSGKSIFTDLQELNPIMGVCRLSIDYSRSFKYLAAYDIKNYMEKFNAEPSVLIMDAPRDEETKYLHEIYGTLEELNNGRVEGFFGGQRIKFRIRRGIKIIVISNSPPVLKSLSSDRWDIKAIFVSVDGKDRLVQQAKVSSNIISVTPPFCTWQTITETVLPTNMPNSKSGQLLSQMFSKNYEDMKRKKYEVMSLKEDCNYIPGIVKSWAPEQTLELSKVPEYVKRQAQKILSIKKGDG